MKNNGFFQQLKQWCLKVSVSSIIFVSVVMLGGTIITLALPSSLDEVKSTRANYQLTAENWDYVVEQVREQMSKLTTLSGRVDTNTTNITHLSWRVDTNTTNITNLNERITNLSWTINNQGSIPAGAVMAFDLSTCPSGWTRFADADNRFIMGAATNSKETGGSASISLTRQQIPSHSHMFRDTAFMENGNADKSANGHTLRVDYQETRNNRPGSNGGIDNDNSLFTVYRKTSGNILAGGNNSHFWVYENGYDLDVSTSQQSVNIQNPYIKLIYCKKN